ncbi:hypothetical protein BC940DRAFT_242061 [Gongronella butleri]|nr:hypothetical protein BC940DRAFT_242061 [Gongronella butleri]
MRLLSLPYEIICNVFSYLSLRDLLLLERTNKRLQIWVLMEIERRILLNSRYEDWNILIHSGFAVVKPAWFDMQKKKVFYSVPMDPILIKVAHQRRKIHCALSHSSSNGSFLRLYDGVTIIINAGMPVGTTEQVDIQGDWCEIHASLTRIPQPQDDLALSESLSSIPFMYSFRVCKLALPLSTLVCTESKNDPR